jgi:hypothetical protein
VANYYELNQMIATSFLLAGINHGKEYRKKRGGGGLYGEPSLFYPPAPGKAGIDEAG